MGESNACMRRIVAAPTAGACGVFPAVLISYQEEYNLSDENQNLMLKSLINKISPMDKVIKGEINFGGEESGRSLVKTALALAFIMDIDLDQCDLAKEYLLNSGTPCFGYFYSPNRDFVKNRNKNIPFHNHSFFHL